MPRHKFTQAETVKGAVSSKRNRLKLAREIKKLTGMEIEGDVIVALLSNPLIVGTAAYIAVAELWTPGANAKALDASNSSTLTGISKFLGTFLNKGLVATVPGLDATLTKDVLLTAIAAYIASGGNLAGTLSSATGLVSKLLPAAATAV